MLSFPEDVLIVNLFPKNACILELNNKMFLLFKNRFLSIYAEMHRQHLLYKFKHRIVFKT